MARHSLTLGLAWLLAGGLAPAGCTDSVPIGKHDGGVGADARADAGGQDGGGGGSDAGHPDAGSRDGGAVQCGSTTCSEGTVCCNASCGICAAPDQACIQIACEDGGAGDCAPMDAGGSGLCDAFFGYAWDGTACRGLSGCNCEGADCDQTFDSRDECEAAFAHCQGGNACGRGLPSCGADEYCDYEPDSCGAADELGTCQPRTQACNFIEAPVCGCDGQTYENECVAFMAGVDILHEGECETSCPGPNPAGCTQDSECPAGSVCESSGDDCIPSGCSCSGGGWVCTADCSGGVCAPSGDCEPMDAEGVGVCQAILGVVWNGSQCQQIGGCDCEGADCDQLYGSVSECEADYEAC